MEEQIDLFRGLVTRKSLESHSKELTLPVTVSGGSGKHTWIGWPFGAVVATRYLAI